MPKRDRKFKVIARNRSHWCSFCGKPEEQVICLIAGPAAMICDECVVLAYQVVVDKKIEMGATAAIGRIVKSA